MKRSLAILAGLAPLALFPVAAAASCESYEVQAGDTLSSIALDKLGSTTRYLEIAAANSEALQSGVDLIFPGLVLALPCDTSNEAVSDDVIAGQRAALRAATDGAGFGPQAPRDLETLVGNNEVVFGVAPASSEMNLCNIHFHQSAEHRGGQFTTFAGNGDGQGYGTGFQYDGVLTEAERAPLSAPIGANSHGGLQSGDTIEIHFVHSSALVAPGPTLGSCLNDVTGNPQLRVETVVAVLVNDSAAASFFQMATIGYVGGYFQAVNIPTDLGTPISYGGSTTGPSYNEKGSPFQVTWSVRPNVVKVDINSVGDWLGNNVFNETYAHGVRNLVTNPDLISSID